MTEEKAGRSSQAEENLALLHRYHETEDEGERERVLALLAEQNVGLVRSVACRYKDRAAVTAAGLELEDLVQIGCIGMLKAIRSFDFTYATAFSTYAVPLIIGEIRRALRDDGMVKVSRDVKTRGYKVMEAKERFLREEGREPTVAELARISGEAVESLVFLLDAATPVHSLSEPVGGDGELTLEQVLTEGESDIDRLTDRLSLIEAISTLGEPERQILRLRYEKQLSQQQTAQLLGITQVKVSRTEKKIFAHLRARLEEK